MRHEINGRTFIFKDATGAAPAMWCEEIVTAAGLRWPQVRREDVIAAERAERDYAEWCEYQDSMEFERMAQIW